MQYPQGDLPGSIQLSDTDVHIWSVRLGAPWKWEEARSSLSHDERERAARIAFDHVRRRFAVSRVALRTILGGYLERPPHKVEIFCTAYGKPQLGDSPSRSILDGQRVGSSPTPAGAAFNAPLRFNLAHSGELALIAVALGCEVGVDIEQVRPVQHLEQLAARYFHPSEAAIVEATKAESRTSAFLRCWTMKEAILKAIGTGIRYPLDAFQVPFEQVEAWADLPPDGEFGGARCWVTAVETSGDYIAALACVGSKQFVRSFHFT